MSEAVWPFVDHDGEIAENLSSGRGGRGAAADPHVAPTRQMLFAALFAGYTSTSPKLPGFDSAHATTSGATQVSVHKSNYGNCKGTYVLAVLHTLSHKDRRNGKNDKAEEKSNGKELGKERGKWGNKSREGRRREKNGCDTWG